MFDVMQEDNAHDGKASQRIHGKDALFHSGSDSMFHTGQDKKGNEDVTKR